MERNVLKSSLTTKHYDMNWLFTSFGRNKILKKYSWIISNSKYSWIISIYLEVLLLFKLWILCIVFCLFRSDPCLQEIVYKLVPNLFNGMNCISFTWQYQKKVLSRLWFDLLINWIYFLNYIEKQQVNCFATSMLSNKVWLHTLFSVFLISMFMKRFCT